MPESSRARQSKARGRKGSAGDSDDFDAHGGQDHPDGPGPTLSDADVPPDAPADGKKRSSKRGGARAGGAADGGDPPPENEREAGQDGGGGKRKGGRREQQPRGGYPSGSRQGNSKAQPLAPACVALKCHHGKHLKAEPNNSLRAASAVVGDPEKFTLTYLEDGKVTLQSHHGRYMTTEANGDVTLSGTAVGESTKWELVKHDGDAISLKGPRGYMAAEKSVLKANRNLIGAWEKFQLKNRSAKQARASADASEQSGVSGPERAENQPFFDCFCELEAVLFAEESYAKTHADKTSAIFKKRAQMRRAQGLELSFRHFREEREYSSAFQGCVSAWDATTILAPGEGARAEEGGPEEAAADAGEASLRSAAGGGASEPRLAWAAILAEGSEAAAGPASSASSASGRSAAPRVRAAFGIPCASAAEADEAALARLRALCLLPCCVAVGPVGLDFAPVPEAEEGEGRHAGLGVAAFLAEFGTRPDGIYEPTSDPACLRWLAAGPNLKAEAWMLKHGDRRLEEFTAAAADYARRRREAQSSAAEAQARLAKELGRPLVVQLPPDDEAERKMVELLVSVFGEGSTHPMLLSAFRGRPRCVVAMVKLFPGLVVGFSGLLTHGKLKATLGEVAFDTPLNRLVLESLGPRYPPAVAGIGDARGSYSHPAHVEAVAEELARVKQLGKDEVLQAAWANARELFALADADATEPGTEEAEA